MEESEKQSYEPYDLWVLFCRTRNAVWKARRKELAKVGISVMHSAVLQAISVLGERATPTEISRWLFLEPHSVSELISRIENSGLVKKEKDKVNKSQVNVSFTEKGLKYYNMQSGGPEIIRRIFSNLSMEERLAFRSIMTKLLKNAVAETVFEEKRAYVSFDKV